MGITNKSYLLLFSFNWFLIIWINFTKWVGQSCPICHSFCDTKCPFTAFWLLQFNFGFERVYPVHKLKPGFGDGSIKQPLQVQCSKSYGQDSMSPFWTKLSSALIGIVVIGGCTGGTGLARQSLIWVTIRSARLSKSEWWPLPWKTLLFLKSLSRTTFALTGSLSFFPCFNTSSSAVGPWWPLWPLIRFLTWWWALWQSAPFELISSTFALTSYWTDTVPT